MSKSNVLLALGAALLLSSSAAVLLHSKSLSASAEIVLESQQQATLAPASAVFEDGAGSKPYVFLRSPDGWQKREVEVGIRSNVAVAVRSGLTKGDVVALDIPQESSQPKGS